MDKSIGNSASNRESTHKSRKFPRADFGRPVFWKPKLSGPADKDGWIRVTQQRTWAARCKRDAIIYERRKRNSKNAVVGSTEYNETKSQQTPEIGELITGN